MIKNEILNFKNIQIDSSIINKEQISWLVHFLLNAIEENVDGDITEFGCYVGESSKYLMKTLLTTKSEKQLFVYDSFEGLPPLSEWEKGTGWKSGTLKTTQDILKSNFERNNLPFPIIHKDWFKNVPLEKIPEKISFAFLDGDFYDSIYDSLSKIYDRVSDGGYIFFHDFRRNDLPGVEAAIKDFFKEREIDYDVISICDQLGVYRKNKKIELPNNSSETSKITLVTGLWDIGRGDLNAGWSRSFNHYLEKFKQLLSTEDNMIIFGEKELEEFVFKIRNHNNTQFIPRSVEWFKNEFFSKIQEIRNNPNWKNLAPWLSESTQSRLEMYNPLVMSKMFLLNDAKILDNFNSEYLFWIDAGITNTVNSGYFNHDKVIQKLDKYVRDFIFVCFPYDAINEIHGFDYRHMCSLVGEKIDKVARGGFFGGRKESISLVNQYYYDLMNQTLNQGFMGTEESIFTLLVYKYPELIGYFNINQDGLVSTFFENLKTDKLKLEFQKTKNQTSTLDMDKVGLYVITFNSPNQFETLINSMIEYDRDFIEKPKKYLLDNSTDLSTTPRYKELCEKYGFEHIKKDNLGICGGRQFISDHFNESDLDVMVFSEDDMFFQNKPGETCRNGFNRYSSNLYQKCLEILQKENFDMLKLNFSEFYGDNGTQWSWYNVPQDFRQKHWPNKPKLPVQGLDPKAPLTEFKNIKSHKGLPYVTGEIYYCNWTHFITKEGNRKMFQETKWLKPFENTWMSHIYQETIKGKVNSGLLLLTPIEHNRFDHYSSDLRREN